jgi:hypothetical protein
MVELAAVIAQAYSASYPDFFIAGIITPPIEAVSATAVPDIPAKIIDEPILANPIPPRMCPNSLSPKSTIFCVIPPTFIRLPANTNPGIANNTKESMPPYIFCGNANRSIPANSK